MSKSTLKNYIRYKWSDLLLQDGARLERWSDILTDFGILQDGEFSATLEQWGRLGTPPETLEEDRLDDWAMLQISLAPLVGVKSQIIEIRSIGFVGAENARLTVIVDGWCAEGYLSFASWGGATLPLPFTTFLLNKTSIPAQNRSAQLSRWAHIRKYIDAVANHLPNLIRVNLDQHLENLIVRTPDHFGLGWFSHPNRNVVSLEISEKLADGSSRVIDLSNLDEESGIVNQIANQPILLPPSALMVARHVKTRQYQVARKVAEEISDPVRVIPEGIQIDDSFDFSNYSDRVIGFERVTPNKAPLQFQSSNIGWYEKSVSPGPFLNLVFSKPENGERTKVTLATPDDAKRLLHDTDVSLKSMMGQAKTKEPITVTFEGISITPTPILRDTLDRALTLYHDRIAHETAPQEVVSPKHSGRIAAIIAEREASATFDSDGILIDENCVPWSLLADLLTPGVILKEHQRRGIAWLLHHRNSGEPGVLLADDMGLGKTLQVAAFLAINQGRGQQRPILIAAPTILLDNWIEEIRRFFRPDVFKETLPLHGERLTSLRTVGNSLLTDQIEKAKLVLTNYETLAAYQISLLRVDFSTVVFDEAQAIKNEFTLRARAARGIKREYAIAMTGTPVENRLSDLWSICDALHPSSKRRAFGNRSNFETEYENNGAEGIRAVRRQLRFPSPTSIVLRREKAEALRDLPTKQFRTVLVPMTAQQYELERNIARDMTKHGPLGILDRLRKLYQHPALLNATDTVINVDQAVTESPKTAATIDILKEVARRGEKAIVFTQWARMQELLVSLFKSHLPLARVNIINGDPDRRSRANEIIDDFTRNPGFDVLVLSPLAAGVGLTITAANHVIHYGRWWNPAKEDQATDRAYRIGQIRPVTVYYPILHHPGNPEEGFDIKLHHLVERKRAISRDFLAPAEDAGYSREIASILGTFEEGRK